jgi:hypothetical protein
MMESKLQPAELELRTRGIFSVADAAGVRFSCREGTVWITLDNDQRDVVLEAGADFTTGEHRRALVYALQPSRVYVEPTGRSPEPARPSLARQSRKRTMEMFSRFQPMPFRKAAR